jgi:hypothetical protein
MAVLRLLLALVLGTSRTSPWRHPLASWLLARVGASRRAVAPGRRREDQALPQRNASVPTRADPGACIEPAADRREALATEWSYAGPSMRLARTPLARAQAQRLLAAAMSCAASCLPSNDLSEYSATPPASSVDDATGALDPPPSMDAPSGAGAAGAASDSPAPIRPGSGTGGPSGAGGTSGTGGAASNGDGPGAGGAGPPPPGDAGLAPSACAAGELQGENEHCYFFDVTATTWLAARVTCRARGAGWDLASVHSAVDAAFLAEHLAFEAWIGATDILDEGTWTWVDDGQPFWVGDGAGAAFGGAFVNWDGTEPNGGRGSNCARAVPRAADAPNPDARWADLACSQLRGAVCEDFSAP